MITAEKLISLLQLFTVERPEWSVEAAATELGLPSSTTYRYFRTLTDAGLIAAVTAGTYALGPTIIMLDRQMQICDPLILAGKRVMQTMQTELHVPGVLLLCRLFRHEVMCIHSMQIGDPGLKVGYERGRPMSLYRGAASKVILANLPARSVKSFFTADPKVFLAAGLGADWNAVKKSLRGIRNIGAVTTYGEVDPGVVGSASPIMGSEGLVIGSLGFVSRADEMDAVRIRKVLKLVTKGAEQLSPRQRDSTAPQCQELVKRGERRHAG